MARSLFSSSWHTVCDLRPRLIPQARSYRQVYRGQVWYVIQDQAGGKYHRLTAPAFALVSAMDGKHTVQELWLKANGEGAGDACTQGEVVELLVQLHGAELLQADVSPDSAALMERYRKKRLATFKQFLLNPMALKVPLVNPDSFLENWRFLAKAVFGLQGLICWLAVVLPATVLAVQHWAALTNDLSGQLLSASNLMLLVLVFPVVKLLHELGHGFATKVWGGTVHEMGVMFLVFAPAPYVDASSSSAFASKYRRAIVAAAGMMVELFLAALAMYVWLLVQPGLVKAVAYNIMVVAGISTLIVNGNPLLRYDGYYILSDLIEMPNLAQRGQRYLAWLWDRHVFGVHDLEAPRESVAERRWLLAYTPLAWCYRVFVTLSIIFFVAGEFFVFGVLIALWGLVTLIAVPVWKAWRHVNASPTLQRHRVRAQRASLALCGVLAVVGFVLPMPLRTYAEGVVWLPDSAILRAGGDGFFRTWLAHPGARVDKGVPVFAIEDSALRTELEVANARVAEADSRFRAEQFSDLVKARLSERLLEQERVVLEKLEQRVSLLTTRAESGGFLVAARSEDMQGRFLRKGEQVAHVLENQALLARVVVLQGDVDLVRQRFVTAELRFADRVSQSVTVKVARFPAGAQEELPSAALGIPGGGIVPTRPDDQQGVRTLERVFILDLSLPEDRPPVAFGERVFVRLDHGWEPLAWQGLRRLRQLLLSHFNV